MSKKRLVGVFNNILDAEQAAEELIQDGISKKRIYVAGGDLDEIRPIAANILEPGRIDPFIIRMALGGAIVGFITGLLTAFIPMISEGGAGAIFWVAFSGATVGGILGLYSAVVSQFDLPQYAGSVYVDERLGSQTILAVEADSSEEHDEAQNILEHHHPNTIYSQAA